MKCIVSRRASWFLQGGYFLCRGSLAPSDRHMILRGWGEKELTRDPGPSDFSSQSPGMRMSKTHWNPPVCGRHPLAFAPPRRPSFCGVSKPVTLEESMLCAQLSWAESENLLISSQEETSVPRLRRETASSWSLMCPRSLSLSFLY